MAVPNTGFDTALGIGIESTWGSAVARTVWVKLLSWDLGRTREKEIVQHLVHGTAGVARDSFVAREVCEPSFSVNGRYGQLGFLLRAALGGTPSTSGTGPYTHTWNMGYSLPSLTLEAILGKTGNRDLVDGWKCNTMEFSHAAGQLAELRFGSIARTSARAGAGTPSFGSNLLMLPGQVGTLSYNSNTYKLNAYSISVNNALSRVDHLGSILTDEPVISNLRTVEFSATIHHRDDNLHDDHHGDVSADATIVVTGTGNDQWTHTLRNAEVLSVSEPISGHGLITQEVRFRAYSDASDEAYSIEIINDNAAYQT